MKVVRDWGCSSVGRAPALQAGGQRFDPVQLHHLLDKELESKRKLLEVELLTGWLEVEP